MADPVFTSEEILAFVADPNKARTDAIFEKLNEIAGTRPTTQAEPTLIILGGSPGVGKSTIIKKLATQNQFISGNDYFVISLDNIIENYEPYRNDIRKKASNAGLNLTKTRKNAYVNNATFESNFQKLNDTTIGAFSGVYIGYSNPRLKDLSKNMSKVRDLIFKKAIERNYNIVYDTTFKERDIIEQDILPVLTDSYKAIKVIHLYTLDIKTIQNRIDARHKNFLKTKNYVRGVPKSLARKFLQENDVYYKKLLDKYQTDELFEFCEFKNDKLETEFTCEEYTPNKQWVLPANNNSRRNNTKKRNLMLVSTPTTAAAAANIPISKKRVNTLRLVAPPTLTSEAASANVPPPIPKRKTKPTTVDPVPPPKSNNANNGSKTAAAAIPTSTRSGRVPRQPQRLGQ